MGILRMQFCPWRLICSHWRSPIWWNLLRYLLLGWLLWRSPFRRFFILPLENSSNRRRLVRCLRSGAVLRRSRSRHFVKMFLRALLFWSTERLRRFVPHWRSSLHRLFKHGWFVIIIRFLMIWVLIWHFVGSFKLWGIIDRNLGRGRNIHWSYLCWGWVILRGHLSLL